MEDSLGNPINVGDILAQGSGDWGMYFYRLREDPKTTVRLRVEDLRNNYKPALSKTSKYYLNLTAVFGERYTNDEIVAIVSKGA